MGVVPHGCSNDNLDLLATRQATHAGVGSKFRLNANILQVLLDDSCGEGAGLQAKASCLLGINLIHHLGETQLLQPTEKLGNVSKGRNETATTLKMLQNISKNRHARLCHMRATRSHLS